jgi:hypothetical protein
MTFAIKSVVLAILSWLMVHAPEFIRPWLKLRRQAFRQKQKMTRRGLESTALRAPRLNKDQALLWMANQLQRQTRTGTPKPTPAAAGNEPPSIRFE